jgi:hypothetical protein
LKSRAGQFAYYVAEHSYFIYHNEQRLYTLLGNLRHSAAAKFDRKHRIDAIATIDYDRFIKEVRKRLWSRADKSRGEVKSCYSFQRQCRQQ